jgi:hypothetical protein
MVDVWGRVAGLPLSQTQRRNTPMEHRCGTRVPMSMAIRLSLPSRTLTGRIVNVSLSGALVTVAERIPEQTRLVVEMDASHQAGSTPPSPILAHVVREADGCVGLEWCVFAPWPVLNLLRHKASQADVRRLHPRIANARDGSDYDSGGDSQPPNPSRSAPLAQPGAEPDTTQAGLTRRAMRPPPSVARESD